MNIIPKCGEWEPVKDFTEMLRAETMHFQERIQQMESNLKSSSESVRALRKVNVSLTEEMQAMRCVCAALVEEGQAASVRAQFKDDIIREMRRQLKQAKAKLKETTEVTVTRSKDFVSGDAECPRGGSGSYDSVTIACVRAQPRRKRDVPIRENFQALHESVAKENLLREDLQREILSKHMVYGNEMCDNPTSDATLDCECGHKLTDREDVEAAESCAYLATSTPDVTTRSLLDDGCSPDVSIIEREGDRRPPSPPILISDTSAEDLQEELKICSPFKCALSTIGSCPKASTKSGNSDIQTQVEDCRFCPDLRNTQSCPEPEKSQADASTFMTRSCLKSTETTKKCVHIQLPGTKDEKCQECVEDLFFEDHSKRNYTSNSGGHWNDHSCKLTEDSGGACSVDSATGSCDVTQRATYYHSKLLSTLQILQNKEETIRVQAESLAMAEGRIMALTERSSELRKELERKTKEVHLLRKTIECFRVEKVDVSITEMENQSDMVSTLQNNLNVIEDLYRECFYETAKQEDLIDMLRKSYLDVRLMDKQKADQIGRMQTVIDTQKWSLDRCQDIAMEVDTLKMEISNFLSSSTPTNNDSGMWERSEESFGSTPGVQEDLQDVMDQLLKLRELLTTDSTFDFEAETKRLKIENSGLMQKISELRDMNVSLEQSVMEQRARDQEHKNEIEYKEQQLSSIKQELNELTLKSEDSRIKCEELKMQLRQAQGDKSERLSDVQEQCDSHQATIIELRQELSKTEHICKELRSEVCHLRSQVCQGRAQLALSDERGRTSEEQLRHARACYREESAVDQLQAQLAQAHERGATLCADARRALASMRHWARRTRDRHREQQNKIKAKDNLICVLKQRLGDFQINSTHCLNTSNNDTSCSKCTSPRQGSFCSRQSRCCTRGASETASCSSAPIPPRRQKKNSICGDVRCPAAPWLCDASTQPPSHHDVCIEPGTSCCLRRRESTRRDISPIEEVFTRVEQLSEALADGYRRWSRQAPR